MGLPRICRGCGARFDRLRDLDHHTEMELCFPESPLRKRGTENVKEKPPIGVVPTRIHEIHRLRDLAGAVLRYTESGVSINADCLIRWTREAAEIAVRIKEDSGNV